MIYLPVEFVVYLIQVDFSLLFLVFPHPGPAQHLFNLFIFWLHQHGELQVLYGVLVSTENLLQVKTAFI